MPSTIPIDVFAQGLPSVALSRKEIKDYLVEHLKSLTNWNEIDKALNETGVLDMVLHLISAGYEVNNFLNMRSAQESLLTYSTLSKSIVEKAKELGYRINRASAPVLKIKYNQIPTINLTRGTVVGTYRGYDVIYFDDDRLIEKGDIIYCKLGKYKEKTIDFDQDEVKFSTIISPETLLSIDNLALELFFDGIKRNKTLFPEDYIVFPYYSDFSDSKVSAKLNIADLTLRHGLAEAVSTSLTRQFIVKYIETDGKLTQVFKQSDLTLTNYDFISLDSRGTDPDTDSEIAEFAPIIYSMIRRAVTEDDFKFLLRNQPIIRDCSVDTYGGVKGSYQISINRLELGYYSISINNVVYSYQRLSDAVTEEDVITILYDQIKGNDILTPSIVDLGAGKKGIKLDSISSRSFLSISVSDNMTNSTLRAQVNPVSCVLHVRYVKSDVVDDPIPISYSEYAAIAAVVDRYKQVGTTLFYESAVRQDVNITLQVHLNDAAQRSLVEDAINYVLNKYDKRIEILIDVSEIISQINSYLRFKYGNAVSAYITSNTQLKTYVDKEHYSNLVTTIIYR